MSSTCPHITITTTKHSLPPPIRTVFSYDDDDIQHYRGETDGTIRIYGKFMTFIILYSHSSSFTLMALYFTECSDEYVYIFVVSAHGAISADV